MLPLTAPIVNDDYFIALVSRAVHRETKCEAILIEIFNRGQPIEWVMSRHNCIEHAEAEAEARYPDLREINGFPVLQER